MVNEIFNFLDKTNKTISFAESCTGGALSTSFTMIPGASKVFLGSIVSYSTYSKQKLLNIDKSNLDKYSPVSERVAITMAENVKKQLNFVDGVMLGRKIYSDPAFLLQIDKEVYGNNTNLEFSKGMQNYMAYILTLKNKKDVVYFEAGNPPKKNYSSCYQSGPLSFEYFCDNQKIITNSGF